MTMIDSTSPLHGDLIALLRAAQAAEHDLFASLSPEMRDAPGAIGEWSAKDVLAHVAAWRSIEARRLEAAADGVDPPGDDPATTDSEEVSNATIHAQRANWSWQTVADDADASIEALVAAFGRSSSEALCACEGTSTGLGASGVNHSLAHLSDVALLAGGHERLAAYATEIETILRGNHLPPRDSGTIFYNIACHRALAGELDDARLHLRAAFARRPDLAEYAANDPDLAALSGELADLAAPA
jgi:hypothetical protein